jgi:hypothetical protein
MTILFIFWRTKAQYLLNDRLCFVIGFPRAGTTLTLNLLRGHPGLSHLRGRKASFGFSLSPSQSLETGILTGRQSWIGDIGVFHIVAKKGLENRGKIIEKTPAHVFAFDRAVRIFGRPKFIIVLRDGRDVVASMLRAGRNPKKWWPDAPQDIREAIKIYQDYARAIMKLQNRDNVYILRYEELIKNPQSHCADLCNFLGVSDRYIVDQVKFAYDDQNLPFPDVRGEGKEGGYLHYLTPNEILSFDEEFYRLNASFGYYSSPVSDTK